MRDVHTRQRAWSEKFHTGRVKDTLDAERARMQQRYDAATAMLCSMEEQVRTVLNEARVQTILYVAYLDYGRQLHRLMNKGMSGDSLALAAQVLLDKWAGRGLDPDVLATIRYGVFNIPAPTP